MIGSVLLTHGELGAGLKNALEGMMGKQAGLVVLSNSGLSKEKLTENLKQACSHPEFQEGVFIFVDMPGSSCWQTAKSLVGNHKKMVVITGVNMPMLVTFFANRERISFDQLVHKVRETGKKAIA